MAVPVLRAVVSTPRVPPVLVMRHDPSRQPATTVVVVAGAGGAEPVGVGPGGVVGLGDELVGELVGEEVGDVVGDSVGSGDGLADVEDLVAGQRALVQAAACRVTAFAVTSLFDPVVMLQAAPAGLATVICKMTAHSALPG